MPVKDPPPPPGKLFWVFAVILCACTLTALLVTALQIKRRKMAARYGERITETAPDAAIPEITLRRGQTTCIEHFSLDFGKASDGLEVHSAQGLPLVRYSDLKKGVEMGWQELRLRLVDVTPDELRIAAAFQPGAPCFGPGDYTTLRTGLRIELPGGRSVTVLGWDAAKSEARLQIESGGRAEELTLGSGPERSVLGVRVALQGQGLH